VISDPITLARFWSKVRVTPRIEDCWEWTAGTKAGGYGRIKIQGRVRTASRLAWEIFHGEPLNERHALHACDNPRCCNPHHIVAGDHAQNMREAKERGLLRSADFSGERNPRARLTESDVVKIRQLIAKGRTNVEIARQFGVAHSMISRIRRGRSWQRVGTNRGGTGNV